MRGRVSRCVAWHVAQSFLAVIAFAWLISPSTAAATTITVDSTVVNVGAGFQLDVGIADVTDLFAYQVSVAFDPTRVQLSSITEGTFLSSAGSTLFFPGFIDNTNGSVIFVADTLTGFVSGASGDGLLFSIAGTAIGAGSSAVSVFFDVSSGDGLFDSNTTLLTSDLVSGTVTARRVTAPEPSTVLLLSTAFGLVLRRRTRRGSHGR